MYLGHTVGELRMLYLEVLEFSKALCQHWEEVCLCVYQMQRNRANSAANKCGDRTVRTQGWWCCILALCRQAMWHSAQGPRGPASWKRIRARLYVSFTAPLPSPPGPQWSRGGAGLWVQPVQADLPEALCAFEGTVQFCSLLSLLLLCATSYVYTCEHVTVGTSPRLRNLSFLLGRYQMFLFFFY